MCGIAGILDFHDPPARDVIAAMAMSIGHRGPDHQGAWIDGPIGLGHRRLSILDLAARANQPMASIDGRYHVVFNGEIYNFPALRNELLALGDRFATTGDTEVILAGYRRDGVASFARLNGMFALAIWDRTEQRLVLARDRFGQKPLYLARSPSGLVFGSEIKCLLASRRVTARIDAPGLHEFCWYGTTLGARTLFAGIERLEPGHHLTIDRDGARQASFWRIDHVRPCADTLEDATARVTSLLEAAVRRHLISDVPVGVLLSGGIDSSAITTLAARHASRVDSYTVSFDFDPGEMAKARLVAEHVGTSHHEFVVRGADIAGVIRALVRQHDQPFGDAANIPLYLVAQQLGGKPKVVLQGDGGDEIFAGYRRYNVLAFERLWRALARGAPALQLLPRHARLERLLHAVGAPDPGRRMALLLTEESAQSAPTRLLGADARVSAEQTDPFVRYGELHRRVGPLDPVQRMLYTDASILLPDLFCEKVDRATMAHGLEVRLPFLDTELTDYVIGLPSSSKVRWLGKKWLLRRALRGTVPDTILNGPKRGFGVPYRAWLRGPLLPVLEATLLHGRSGMFDPEACRRAIDEHATGRVDHGFLLYKMLQLALWAEEYL
ncbi:asparagine synthase (glutamine-hydrolyzing) [Bauldia litoralis]|uniref:asparagine synthase (glutamine-hydrolyzing) n=1 Tax=Bauldia litoralis TaxID=665467 RepID=A0A1G6CVJ6_9HYPH|nr:asparagine synthase (glutamine-hydrolyzing) [Bauldia litoralis]SDB36890.1 asparagine synthase (glutamine-hydrolysing) [Bauldia litoralis]